MPPTSMIISGSVHLQPRNVAQNNQIFINGSFRSDIDVNYAQNGLQPPLRCSELPPTEYQEKRGWAFEDNS